MNIKRMLLLLSAMAALVAFAAPAAQANSWWSTDPGDTVLGGEAEKETFTATGSLSSIGKTGLRTGPAVVHAHGYLWNGPEHGEGYITDFEITDEVSTNLPNCVATGTNSTTPNGPGNGHGAQWAITLTTNNDVHIEDVTFTNHYSAPCQAFGVPSTVPATGDVTGIYNNATGCIEVEEGFGTDSVFIEGTEIEVDIAGEVCLHEEGGTFTANTE